MKLYDIWKNKSNQNIFVFALTAIAIALAVCVVVVTTSSRAAELKNFKTQTAESLKTEYAFVYSEGDAESAVSRIIDGALFKIKSARSINAVVSAANEAKGLIKKEYGEAVIKNLRSLYKEDDYTAENYAEITAVIDETEKDIKHLSLKEEIDEKIAAARARIDGIEKIQAD
ncbi:MAG: hypothetical protein LBP62_01975 [Clostridiales bacterium]|jgi:ABC-type lipoprotein release transport system permease subunit|nr:hypothetical protein [Clostridiales bacterium]